MYKYEIIMYWRNEDKTFVAEVPELPGCTAHGNTQQDSLKNINAAMALWIDVARDHGDHIPVPKGHRLLYA